MCIYIYTNYLNVADFKDSQHHIDATTLTVTLTRNIKKLQTHKVNRRTFPAYLCLCWLSSVSNFIYPDKTELDSQNWRDRPWKSNENRLVTMCCIFCYLILVHPLIDLNCLHSSEWGIVCVTSSAFYENEFDNDYHNFFDFLDPK